MKGLHSGLLEGFEGSPRCLRARPQKWKSPGSSVLRSSLPVHLLMPLTLSTLTDSLLNPSSYPGHLLTHSLSTHTQPTPSSHPLTARSPAFRKPGLTRVSCQSIDPTS